MLTMLGCSALPADRGWSDVNQLVSTRDQRLVSQPNQQIATVKLAQQVEALLAQPITADTAIAVSMLRHPMIQLEYAKLGLAQADVLEASRLSNPVLSVSAIGSNISTDQTRYGYGLVQNFTELLFLRSRRQAAQLELQRLKATTGMQLQQHAAEVAHAYYQLVNAEQLLDMQQLIAKAATASSTLAERFYTAGNINALEFSREQAATTQAELDVDRARAQVLVSRNQLAVLMGLTAAEQQWQINKQLPLPVHSEDGLEQLQQLALNNRLDLAAKRKQAEAYAQALGLSQTLRWLPLLEIGIDGERDSDGARLLGPTAAIELPIFGRNRSGILRMQAYVEQTSLEAHALEVNILHQVNLSFARMLAARQLFERYRTQLVPQREAVVTRTLEMHNYMLVGQFDLLLAKQQEYDAYRGQLQALSDYWLSRVELSKVVAGKLPSDAQIGQSTLGVVVLPDASAEHDMPSMADMDHSSMADMDHSSMPDMDHSKMDQSTMPHGQTNLPAPTADAASPKPASSDASPDMHNHHTPAR
ncbi:MAG: TolC family protein [Flavobacteriales bacterium]